MATTTFNVTSMSSIPESLPIVPAATQWADSPYALIPDPLQDTKAYNDKNTHAADLMAHDMSHLHNMILRGLNSIWQQAPYVTSQQDIRYFLSYASIWCEFLHHHHDTEELNFFPAIEALIGKPGFMDGNVEQHKAFEAGLEQMMKYCRETTPLAYSASDLRNIIDAFGPTLRQHLADEIPSLQSLREYDSAKLKAIWKAAGEHSRSNAESHKQLPFMVGTHDVDMAGGKAGEFHFNFFVLWINDFILSYKYTNEWRFLPCDGKSHRRELAFGPSSNGVSLHAAKKTSPPKKQRGTWTPIFYTISDALNNL